MSIYFMAQNIIRKVIKSLFSIWIIHENDGFLMFPSCDPDPNIDCLLAEDDEALYKYLSTSLQMWHHGQ